MAGKAIATRRSSQLLGVLLDRCGGGSQFRQCFNKVHHSCHCMHGHEQINMRDIQVNLELRQPPVFSSQTTSEDCSSFHFRQDMCFRGALVADCAPFTQWRCNSYLQQVNGGIKKKIRRIRESDEERGRGGGGSGGWRAPYVCVCVLGGKGKGRGVKLCTLLFVKPAAKRARRTPGTNKLHIPASRLLESDSCRTPVLRVPLRYFCAGLPRVAPANLRPIATLQNRQ